MIKDRVNPDGSITVGIIEDEIKVEAEKPAETPKKKSSKKSK